MIDWILAHKLFYDFVLLVACTIAIGFGGIPEKVGAAIVIVASGATALVSPISNALDIHARYGFGIVDVLTLVAFDALMIRSRRAWTIWATGIQLAAVSIDAAMLIEPVAARPFMIASGKFAYLILFALAASAARYRKDMRGA